MSERKPQNKYVLVRFRSPVEQAQWERENLSRGGMPIPIAQIPDLSNLSELQKRMQRIKEVMRQGSLLRVDLGLSEVLQKIVASIASCLSFRASVINLIEDDGKYFSSVAFAGLTEEDERILRDAHEPVEKLTGLMDSKFRIGQSYFISHEHAEVSSGMTAVAIRAIEDYEPGGWHPEDLLIVPLFSPRGQKLVGFLSLDDPENGRIPTAESIEIAELFANQAASAIDTARLFEERETERLALEESIARLQEDLVPIQRRDLRMRIQSTHAKLRPVGDAINTTLEEICSILGSMQMVTQAVDEHTRNVQRSTEFLVRDTSQQERQVNQISRAIADIAELMQQISERAANLSRTAVDAVDVTSGAQDTVDRAVEGMSKVREATLQSARTMKSLGERGQGIAEAVLEVSDLSVRLHHLALNAAIESTRAGEHGKGFATIAQEIRTLAVSSTQAARNVSTYIRTIQNETNTVSHSVEQNTQQVVMQTELVTQTGVALDVISEVTEQLSRLIDGICATAGNQLQGSQLVVSSVDEILRMTVDITQHTREMQYSMSHLVELTNSLRQRIAVFHIGER